MRSFNRLSSCCVGLMFTVFIGGCDGTSISNLFSSSSSSSSAVATGIWSGTDSTSNESVVGLINSAGQADFIRADGTQFIGTVQIAGSALAATLSGYAYFGSTLADGSTTGIGTLNATVSTANSIVGTLTFTSSIGTSYPGSWSLSYLPFSTTGSSLASISGAYTDTSNVENSNSGGTVTITANGSISSQGATSGCIMDGSIGVGDSTTDIYEISYTYSGCTGQWASLNDVPFTGLMILNTTLLPEQILVGVSGQATSGAKYGLVNSLSLN